MNPIKQIIDHYKFEPFDLVTRDAIKYNIMKLGIEGLVEVGLELKDDGILVVHPLFDTQENYMWFCLRYGSI